MPCAITQLLSCFVSRSFRNISAATVSNFRYAKMVFAINSDWAGVLSGIVFCAWLSILCFNFRCQKKFDRLSTDLRNLNIQQANAADVKALMIRHGGRSFPAISQNCESPGPERDEVYTFGTANPALDKLAYAHPVLRLLGLRAQEMEITVTLENNHICYFNVRVGMENFDGWYWRVETVLLAPSNTGIWEEPLHVTLHQFTGFGSLQAQLTHAATPDQIRHALTADFACVTSFRGCQHPCDIAPALWQEAVRNFQEAVRQSPEVVWNFPNKEYSDKYCK